MSPNPNPNPNPNPISLTPSLSQGFILQVKIHISPTRIPEFFTHFTPIHALVLAEPECRFFVVGQDTQDPGCIMWTEGWARDQRWFMDVQIKKEYYTEYLRVTEGMFLKPREVTIVSPLAGLSHFKVPELE